MNVIASQSVLTFPPNPDYVYLKSPMPITNQPDNQNGAWAFPDIPAAIMRRTEDEHAFPQR